MARRIWKHPLTWGFVLTAGVMAFIMTFSYIGAFVDPQGNMHNMPLVLANEDAGAALSEGRINLGEQVIAAVTAPNPQPGDAVTWKIVGSREEAVHRINDNQAYGGLVVPPDFSARVLALSNPAAFAGGPARIEVLTNPAAGSIAGTEGQAIALAAAARVSKTTSAQLVDILRGAGVNVRPDDASVLADPVQPTVTVAQPIGAKSGRGITPLYFAVMMTLAGFVGATLVDVGVNHMVGRLDLEVLGLTLRRPPVELSSTARWATKLGLTLVVAVLAGLLQTWMAVGILGMDASSGWGLALFATLGVGATALLTLFFLTAFGEAGLIPGVLFTTIFGVPSAGGVYPPEMLPGFFQFLSSWLPLRYMTDGTRALLFFDGRLEVGLGRALWVLGVYGLGSTLLGGATAALIDRALAGRASKRTRASGLEPAGSSVIAPRPAARPSALARKTHRTRTAERPRACHDHNEVGSR